MLILQERRGPLYRKISCVCVLDTREQNRKPTNVTVLKIPPHYSRQCNISCNAKYYKSSVNEICLLKLMSLK